MPRLPKGTPRSVVDPDAVAYDHMIRGQRLRNGLIEMGPARAREAQDVADTAGTAGDVLTGARAIPGAAAQITGGAEDLAAFKAAQKANGLLGPVLTAAQDLAQYRADRARGMPADEAAIKNIGGMVLGTGLGGLSEAETLELGPAVATALGWAGNKDGHMAADAMANGWAGAKRFGRQVRDTTAEGLQRLSAPPPGFYDRMFRQ